MTSTDSSGTTSVSNETEQSPSGYTPRRLESMPSYSNNASPNELVVNEKVVSMPRSVRTNSRRARRATLLRFVQLKDHANVARVQVLLCNISDRPMRYKLKSETGAEIAALPSGKGFVPAKGSSRLVLTWRRPKQFSSWSTTNQPKLLLITQFMDGASPEENKLTSTRFIARVSPLERCSAEKAPLEQLMLDAGANTRRASAEYDKHEEMTVTSAEQVANPNRSRNALDEFVDWLCDQPRSVLLILLIIAFIIYTLGMADATYRHRHYYNDD